MTEPNEHDRYTAAKHTFGMLGFTEDVIAWVSDGDESKLGYFTSTIIAMTNLAQLLANHRDYAVKTSGFGFAHKLLHDMYKDRYGSSFPFDVRLLAFVKEFP